jgi:hypothetical protein
MVAVLSFSTNPVPGLLAMVSKRDHPQLVPPRVVDDTEWEPADRETTSSVPPMRAKPRLFTEQHECALELVDEFGS